MKRFLIGSVALITVGVLAVVGFALLGPDGALAQDSDDGDIITKYRFGPLDEVLDELIEEGVIDGGQADAIRERMSEKMPALRDGFHFRMDGFLDELPEGLTAPPGRPGSPEFDSWLDEMQELLGDDFQGGRMFRFDGEFPEGGPFHFRGPGRMGPGMMGDGFHQFGDLGDLDQHIAEMEEFFGGELPEHMQDMLDYLNDQLEEASIDA
jgi:hypothetical protein